MIHYCLCQCHVTPRVRPFPVREAETSGTWHSWHVACGMTWHVLVMSSVLWLLPLPLRFKDSFVPGSHGNQNHSARVGAYPCGKDQASALWDLHVAHTHNSVFHPMCPSQSACQQFVEAVALVESQGLGQES